MVTHEKALLLLHSTATDECQQQQPSGSPSTFQQLQFVPGVKQGIKSVTDFYRLHFGRDKHITLEE